MDRQDEWTDFINIKDYSLVLLRTVPPPLYKATFYEAMFFNLMHFLFFILNVLPFL